MVVEIKPGDCVRIPDGRIGRDCSNIRGVYRIQVRRKTSPTHQFLEFSEKDLVKIACPKGSSSPQGYNRYLKITLEKMQTRLQRRER